MSKPSVTLMRRDQLITEPYCCQQCGAETPTATFHETYYHGELRQRSSADEFYEELIREHGLVPYMRKGNEDDFIMDLFYRVPGHYTKLKYGHFCRMRCAVDFANDVMDRVNVLEKQMEDL